ncbi:hypothetical protein, partial [Halolactibacillus alkaliphilus]|uniref:hypothetical protein n=1 Tax=Halolactibacillus alkaliphilus TaxID=442899 RepID=UPI001E49183A
YHNKKKDKIKNLWAVAQPTFISPLSSATPFTRLKRETSFGSALKFQQTYFHGRPFKISHKNSPLQKENLHFSNY